MQTTTTEASEDTNSGFLDAPIDQAWHLFKELSPSTKNIVYVSFILFLFLSGIGNRLAGLKEFWSFVGSLWNGIRRLARWTFSHKDRTAKVFRHVTSWSIAVRERGIRVPQWLRYAFRPLLRLSSGIKLDDLSREACIPLDSRVAPSERARLFEKIVTLIGLSLIRPSSPKPAFLVKECKRITGDTESAGSTDEDACDELLVRVARSEHRKHLKESIRAGTVRGVKLLLVSSAGTLLSDGADVRRIAVRYRKIRMSKEFDDGLIIPLASAGQQCLTHLSDEQIGELTLRRAIQLAEDHHDDFASSGDVASDEPVRVLGGASYSPAALTTPSSVRNARDPWSLPRILRYCVPLLLLVIPLLAYVGSWYLVQESARQTSVVVQIMAAVFLLGTFLAVDIAVVHVVRYVVAELPRTRSWTATTTSCMSVGRRLRKRSES